MLVSRGQGSFERELSAGSRISLKGGAKTPTEDVRLTTFDVMTGKMHLQGAEGETLEPVLLEDLRTIAQYREPDLNLWAAIGLGVGGGALVGGWFWYNAFEYVEYEGDELWEVTLVTTALTTLATGILVPWIFSKSTSFQVSTVGPTGEWELKGRSTLAGDPPDALEGPKSAPVPLPTPSEPVPEVVASPPEGVEMGEGGRGFWHSVKERLFEVRVGEVWGRYRVGTAYPEGVQLKAVGSPRGRVVPYSDIQEVRRLPGDLESP